VAQAQALHLDARTTLYTREAFDLQRAVAKKIEAHDQLLLARFTVPFGLGQLLLFAWLDRKLGNAATPIEGIAFIAYMAITIVLIVRWVRRSRAAPQVSGRGARIEDCRSGSRSRPDAATRAVGGSSRCRRNETGEGRNGRIVARRAVGTVWGRDRHVENAIRACPDTLWRDRSRRPEFWYSRSTPSSSSTSTSRNPRTFVPPAPFTMSEMDPTGVLPERVYEKSELLAYLERGRARCREVLAALTDASLNERCGFMRRDLTVAELHVYSLRHVQHHAAQLNLILRQVTDSAPTWVGKTNVPLEG
jgi:hypothetical protein